MRARLQAFPRATPELLAERALLRRVDTKYAIDLGMLKEVLGHVEEDYAVLLAGNATVASYETLYYDTPGLDCLEDHRRGRRPRFKIRVRHYLDREKSFLEIKKKNAAERTEKQRRVVTFRESGLSDEDRRFVDQHCPIPARDIEPAMWTLFERVTLLGLRTEERLTADFGVSFQHDESKTEIPGVVILEIKQARFAARSPIMMALRRYGLRPLSISKYCAGMSMLRTQVRLRRYMPRLRAIERIHSAA